MKTKHADHFQEDDLAFIVEISAHPITPTLEHCPFCSYTDENLEEHVGQHLREFALCSLPWPEHEEKKSQQCKSESTSSADSRETLNEFREWLPSPVFDDVEDNDNDGPMENRLGLYGDFPGIAAQHEPLLLEYLNDDIIEAFACNKYKVDNMEALVLLLSRKTAHIMSISPTPSYHLCPDFPIPPPPNGHLTLGTILPSLGLEGVLRPLNLNSVPDIPAEFKFPKDGPHSITNFTRTLKQLRTVKGSIWAQLFSSGGPSEKFNFLSTRDDDETLTIADVQTTYIIPSEEYMKKALENDGVSLFINVTKMKVPVYMITGIKVAYGAKLSGLHSRIKNASGEANVTEPNSGISAGAEAGYESENTASTGFDGSTPFILGIRVRKIWWKKGIRQTNDNVSGSILADSDGEDAPSLLVGLEFEDDFVAEDNSLNQAKVIEEVDELTGPEPCQWVLRS
ncbi:hypothetical protein Trisim1_006165 [Trichoderma cf. simile WF8]